MEIQINGLRDLERRLKMLPEKIQRVTLIKATKAGAAPILAAAQAKVPKLTGNLSKKLRIKFTRRSITSAEASVGVFGLSGAARKRAVAKHLKGGTGLLPTAREIGDPYYALFVEKGHDIVTRGVTGKTTKRLHARGGGRGTVKGHVAPRPFLRPALDENKDRVVAIVAQVLREEIDAAERL